MGEVRKREYSCKKCGGKVTSNHNGGLGHWHCERGCQPTIVKVTLREVLSEAENQEER